MNLSTCISTNYLGQFLNNGSQTTLLSLCFWYNIKEEDDKVRKDFSMEILPLITPDYRHYTIHLNSLWIEVGTFRRERIKTSENYIAMLTGDNSMIINSYNNWGFQGIIPEHSRGLFTPNGIILTPVELMELLSRKSLPQRI